MKYEAIEHGEASAGCWDKVAEHYPWAVLQYGPRAVGAIVIAMFATEQSAKAFAEYKKGR